MPEDIQGDGGIRREAVMESNKGYLLYLNTILRYFHFMLLYTSFTRNKD